MAEFIGAQIAENFKISGATDVTAKYRTQLVNNLVAADVSLLYLNSEEVRADSCQLLLSENSPRKAEFDGSVYLRPTIVLCVSFQHPLVNKEFLCPCACVVQVPQNEMLKQIGCSLAVTAITKDKKFIEQLTEFPHIERLNISRFPQ